MPGPEGNQFFEAVLKEALGNDLAVIGSQFKSGGCINNAMQLSTSIGDFFVKWQKGIPNDMFQKEAEGLQLLAKADAIKIPEVIAFGKIDGKQYLLLENIESAPASATYWKDFGEALAAIHSQNSAGSYGLGHDNYIGKLPQPNKQRNSWIDFFVENRLEYQLQLAFQNGLVPVDFTNRYRNLYNLLPDLLPADQPALLHGDLWSGNVMVGNDGKVCLIDPAVYYGHREIELAFTKLFGGFGYDFYAAYNSTYPLEAGFEERVDIYNIYPLMVHVNLFGTSYLTGVESVLKRYL
jgi:fructosamine-3-kinase